MIETESTNRGATAIKVAPLAVINALSVYGQGAYAYEQVTPHKWEIVFRIVLAIGFAVATESVSLYVQWHAHDALLLKSHATARQLRRYSYLIAAAVAAMNYSHFSAAGYRPTAAAVAFGMLSLLSPWTWGLHTRRQARVQLLKERRADEGGAEFSSERRRAFPIHTFKARRYSIWNNIIDPHAAWDAYVASLEPPTRTLPVADEQSVASMVASVRPSRPSNKVAAWDVEKAVRLVLDGQTPVEILAAVDGMGAKPLQLLRRCVRLLQQELDVETVAARVPCSLPHVQRVKAAMA